MVLCRWKPSGSVVIFSPIRLSVLEIDAGLAAARIVAVGRDGLEAGPAAVEPVGLVGW